MIDRIATRPLGCLCIDGKGPREYRTRGKPMGWLTSLTTTKSIDRLAAEASETRERSLKRVLGPSRLVMLGMGDIIGAGIFVLTGLAAAQYAGPAILLSFALAAVAYGFAGLCHSEFAAMMPISGSPHGSPSSEFPAQSGGLQVSGAPFPFRV
jgi:amino acid permease